MKVVRLNNNKKEEKKSSQQEVKETLDNYQQAQERVNKLIARQEKMLEKIKKSLS